MQQFVGSGLGAVEDVCGEVGFDLCVGQSQYGDVVGKAQGDQNIGNAVYRAEEVNQRAGNNPFRLGRRGGGAVEVVSAYSCLTTGAPRRAA